MYNESRPHRSTMDSVEITPHSNMDPTILTVPQATLVDTTTITDYSGSTLPESTFEFVDQSNLPNTTNGSIWMHTLDDVPGAAPSWGMTI